jgi:hypothetical protein
MEIKFEVTWQDITKTLVFDDPVLAKYARSELMARGAEVGPPRVEHRPIGQKPHEKKFIPFSFKR